MQLINGQWVNQTYVLMNSVEKAEASSTVRHRKECRDFRCENLMANHISLLFWSCSKNNNLGLIGVYSFLSE